MYGATTHQRVRNLNFFGHTIEKIRLAADFLLLRLLSLLPSVYPGWIIQHDQLRAL